jgi:Holliday junction resolvase RusA-like endonuclease
MNITFHIPCIPPTVTAQQKGAFAAKGGGVRFFKKKPVKQAENSLTALLYPFRPEKPMQGPLTLIVTLAYPWRKSEKKSRIKEFGSYPIETRPDVDNIYKMLGDVMTTLGFWSDDGQIANLHVGKVYSDSPGISINITSAIVKRRDGTFTTAMP